MEDEDDIVMHTKLAAGKLSKIFRPADGQCK